MDEQFERHLEAALKTRPVIEQAKGILAGHLRHPPHRAFEELVRASQQHNVRVADIAEGLVSLAAGEVERMDETLRNLIAHEWDGLVSGWPAHDVPVSG